MYGRDLIPEDAKNVGRLFSVVPWPSRGFESETDGTAFGPLSITKRQAATDTVAKPGQFGFGLHLVHARIVCVIVRRRKNSLS